MINCLCFQSGDSTALQIQTQVTRQPFFNNFYVYISLLNLSHPKHAQNRFKHFKSPVQILPISVETYTGHAISANFESKSIDELLLLDLTLHKVSLSLRTYSPNSPLKKKTDFSCCI